MPHGAEHGPFVDQGGNDDQAALRRLRQFFVWDTRSCFAGIAFLLITYWRLRLPSFAIVAGAVTGDVILLWWARRMAERQRMLASMVVVCIGLWFVQLMVAHYLPATLPMLGILVIWPVVVPLPFITGRPLKLIMVISTLMALLTVVVASRPLTDLDRIPPAFVQATLVVAVPVMAGLISLVLWQYNTRLNETLERTRQANLALRESERLLEEKVERRTRELSEARDAALAATQAKSAFLANMSHELRTPLNAVLGYSEMLQEEAIEQGKSEFVPDLRRIHSAGRHLLTLISDVLDLSKIESGRWELVLDTFSVSGLVQEVIELIRPLVRRGVGLEVHFDGTVGDGYADPIKLRQALFNLLSNACKFTEQGNITLEVDQVGETSLSERRLRFAVSDTGIGMTSAELTRIFQPFSQANASTARQYGGTGLGLAISRRFCQLMGGDVTASSEAGRGSTFTLWIPAIVRPAGAVSAPGESLASGPPGQARKVLVVDDDAQTQDLLKRFLEKDGYEVHVASDGEEGLKLARAMRPDLITLDVMMPRLDGWTMLALLKQDQGLAGIPVILITILDQREQGLTRGAVELLTKPVGRERLLAVVTQHARQVPAARLLLVIDDDPEVRALLRRMLEPQGWAVIEAENGSVALEHLAQHKPNLILLDLLMPTMDGFAFLEAFRDRGEAGAAPVVVLTAKDLTEEDRGRLRGCVLRVLEKGDLSGGRVAREIDEVMTASPSAEPTADR
jgi:signal transduction histidine kinase/CheY-like chemotaxis protein